MVIHAGETWLNISQLHLRVFVFSLSSICMDSSRDTQEPERSCYHIPVATFRLIVERNSWQRERKRSFGNPHLIQRADLAAWPELEVMSTNSRHPAENSHHAHAHGYRLHRCAFSKALFPPMCLAYSEFTTLKKKRGNQGSRQRQRNRKVGRRNGSLSSGNALCRQLGLACIQKRDINTVLLLKQDPALAGWSSEIQATWDWRSELKHIYRLHSSRF